MKPEDLTSEVWDYVLLGGPQPQHSAIPAQTLAALRREFEFWYPFDLRVGLHHNIFVPYNSPRNESCSIST